MPSSDKRSIQRHFKFIMSYRGWALRSMGSKSAFSTLKAYWPLKLNRWQPSKSVRKNSLDRPRLAPRKSKSDKNVRRKEELAKRNAARRETRRDVSSRTIAES